MRACAATASAAVRRWLDSHFALLDGDAAGEGLLRALVFPCCLAACVCLMLGGVCWQVGRLLTPLLVIGSPWRWSRSSWTCTTTLVVMGREVRACSVLWVGVVWVVGAQWLCVGTDAFWFLYVFRYRCDLVLFEWCLCLSGCPARCRCCCCWPLLMGLWRTCATPAGGGILEPEAPHSAERQEQPRRSQQAAAGQGGGTEAGQAGQESRPGGLGPGGLGAEGAEEPREEGSGQRGAGGAGQGQSVQPEQPGQPGEGQHEEPEAGVHGEAHGGDRGEEEAEVHGEAHRGDREEEEAQEAEEEQAAGAQAGQKGKGRGKGQGKKGRAAGAKRKQAGGAGAGGEAGAAKRPRVQDPEKVKARQAAKEAQQALGAALRAERPRRGAAASRD